MKKLLLAATAVTALGFAAPASATTVAGNDAAAATTATSCTASPAGANNATGIAYNEKADKRSWVAMRAFFDEIFA